jgi:hypothetical protein
MRPPAFSADTLSHRPRRRRRPRRAWLAGLPGAALVAAAGCVGPALARPDVSSRIESITPGRVEAHVRALCALGPRPAADAEAVAASLEHLSATLRRWGYAPVEERFEGTVTVTTVLDRGGPAASDGEQAGAVLRYPARAVLRNLIVERRGSERPDIVVELGAHYDTLASTVGADDNASGVAVLLEVARVLADAPVRRTVRLCFFAGEEDGLLGSREHVRRRAPVRSGILDGALIVDMVGFASRDHGSQDFPVRIPLLLDPPATGDFVLILGDWDSAPLADHYERAVALYAPELATWGIKRLAGLGSGNGRADHDAYWEAGERAVLLNDTAEFRSPHYHRASDTPDTLDYGFLAAVTRAACAWALERADLPPGSRGADGGTECGAVVPAPRLPARFPRAP